MEKEETNTHKLKTVLVIWEMVLKRCLYD